LSTDSDLIAIVRRIDQDNDAMLNSEEFSQVLRVVEPGSSYYLKHDEGRRREMFERRADADMHLSSAMRGSEGSSSPLRRSSPRRQTYEPV
jgi:hypothetical protein